MIRTAALLVTVLLPFHALAASSAKASSKSAAKGVVHAELLKDKSAYFRVKTFDARVAAELRKRAQELQKHKPRGAIVDLRQSPGGTSLPALDELLELFLPNKTPYMKIANDYGKVLQVTDQNPVFRKSQPLVILIDEKTNNEATIAAAVLQRYRAAAVVQEVPPEATPSTAAIPSVRVRDYIAIKEGFIVKWNDRVIRSTSRLDAADTDGALSRAVSMMRELSPWAETSKK